MRKSTKTYEESMQIFIEELRKNGVSDKTIKRVVYEVQEHTKKILEEQLKNVYSNIKDTIKKQLEED